MRDFPDQMDIQLVCCKVSGCLDVWMSVWVSGWMYSLLHSLVHLQYDSESTAVSRVAVITVAASRVQGILKLTVSYLDTEHSGG